MPLCRIQQRLQSFRRRLRLRLGVIIVAELAQRRVKLRRKQQNKQSALIRHRHHAFCPRQHADQAQTQINRHQRNRQRGKQFQHRAG